MTFQDIIFLFNQNASRFKSDQSEICYLKLLMRLVAFYERSLFQNRQDRVEKVKQILSLPEFISKDEYHFAFVANLAQEISLLDEWTNEVVNPLTAFISASADSAFTYIYNQALLRYVEGDLSRKEQDKLLQILICCESRKTTNFDPFTSINKIKGALQKSFPGLERYRYKAYALSDPPYLEYFRSLAQFNKKELSDYLPSEMKDYLDDLKEEAHRLYFNPESTTPAKNACKEMLDGIFSYVSAIVAQKKQKPPINDQQITSLLAKAEDVKVKIDSLEQLAPKSCDWKKIIILSLSTLLFGLFFIIPSILIYKADSSFVHSPAVTQARAFVEQVQEKIGYLKPPSPPSGYARV